MASIGVNISRRRGILSVATPLESEAPTRPDPRKGSGRVEIQSIFDKNDLEGMPQVHDDALVATSWIGGFMVKRVMIDQGSGVEIMYPDLYKGLG